MPSPFEVPFAEVQANIDSLWTRFSTSLQSGFMTLPKGPGFIEYPTFEHGYEALKRTTGDPRHVAGPVLALGLADASCRTYSRFRIGRKPTISARWSMGLHMPTLWATCARFRSRSRESGCSVLAERSGARTTFRA